MATSQSVGSGKSNNLLVVESHAVEDVTEVILGLGGIGKTSIWIISVTISNKRITTSGLHTRSASSNILVGTSRTVRNLRSSHLLDSTNSSKNPQVGVGDPRVLGLNGLNSVTGNLQTGIGSVVGLGGETHGSSVGSSGLGVLVVGSGSVPSETKKDLGYNNQLLIPSLKRWKNLEILGMGWEAYRSVGSIIKVVVLKDLSNVVVNLLVVLKGRLEDSGAGNLVVQRTKLSLGVKVVTGTSSSSSGSKTSVKASVALGRRGRRVSSSCGTTDGSKNLRAGDGTKERTSEGHCDVDLVDDD